VIIGQGGAMRATAGLVGHGGCLINGRPVLAASYSSKTSGWETNSACYTMSAALGPLVGKDAWESAHGVWMGHDISNAKAFRSSSLYEQFEGEAVLAVMDAAALGEDPVTDLVLVNMKGPDYVAHAWGPDSPELKATLAELDRQMAAILALLDRQAGPGQSVVVITADHGMPAEPAPGHRHYTDEIIPLVNGRFDAGGQGIILDYDDAANSQMYIDTARLRSLGYSLADVATYLESLDYIAAAFTEDEVREAQSRLAKKSVAANAP
jgi:hypothetical protein